MTNQEIVNLTNDIIRKSNRVEQRVKNIEFSLIETTKHLGAMANNISMLGNYFLQKKEIEYLESVLNFIKIAEKCGLELKI